MSFVDQANLFIKDPGNLKSSKYVFAMVDTVDYLLEHGTGLANAVPTDTIIQYLNSKGHKIRKPEWQINVLGPLRDNSIFIGSKIGTGIFIINSINDANEVRTSMRNRIVTHKKRLDVLENLMKLEGWAVVD